MFLAKLTRRWKDGDLNVGLATLQISCMVMAIVAGISSIMLYRHFSDDYYIDVWKYLGSVRIAVPPLAILVASYAFATVSGKPLTDAPKAFWSWLRNSFMQRSNWLLGFVFLTACLCAGIGLILKTTTPPKYERFVERLLGGASDEHQLAAEDVKRMREHNRDYADNMDLVVKVFVERQKWNYDNQNPSTTLPRVLIRALTPTADDRDWASHPLRKHAAAEANGMYAQAISNSSGRMQTDKRLLEDAKKTALDLYSEVASSNDPRATAMMKGSAGNNIGNLHYYVGASEEAIKQYRTSLAAFPTSGGYGNLIAALVSAGRIVEALKYGEQGKEWALSHRRALAEPIPFANLVSNLGFAYWMILQPDKALPEMESAFDLVADANSIQNLSLAQLLAGDASLAFETARKLKDVQASPETQADLVGKVEPGRCTYFVRGLAALSLKTSEGTLEGMVNLRVFLGEAKSASDLRSDVSKGLDDLKARTYKTLGALRSPCASLSMLPGVKALLAVKSSTAQ